MVDINYLVWVAAFSMLFGFVSYMASRIVFDFFIKRKMYFWAGAAFPVGIYALISYQEHLATISVLAVLATATVFGFLSGFIPDRILNHFVNRER